jgi:hypothetical protein
VFWTKKGTYTNIANKGETVFISAGLVAGALALGGLGSPPATGHGQNGMHLRGRSRHVLWAAKYASGMSGQDGMNGAGNHDDDVNVTSSSR